MMRQFTAEQVNAAVMHIAQNLSSDRSQLRAVAEALDGPLFSPFLAMAEKLEFEVGSRKELFNVLVAFFTYGIAVSETMRELECEPGDFHCLEHKEKNCTCAETTSQVGKDEEILNPAGPRYF